MKEKQDLNDTTSSSESGSPPVTPRMKPNDNETNIVPNAIVIKNIPFSVKRDTFVAMLDEEGIPTPYALNYHFDNGIFRGLAFANYRTQDVAHAAVHEINRITLNGRQLRAEFKRMLHTGVEKEGRDTIELEGSLRKLMIQNAERQEESINEHRRGRPKPEAKQFPAAKGWDRLDLKDLSVQRLIAEIKNFKEHSKEKEIILPNLNGKRRRDAHIIAEELSLGHFAEGTYPVRFMHITKDVADTEKSSLVQEEGSRDTARRPTTRLSGLGSNNNSSTTLAASSESGSVIRPIRQPRGPEPGKNFETRKHLAQQVRHANCLCQQPGVRV